MRGALKARREGFEVQRKLALMGAYYTGFLATFDWKAARIPFSFEDWYTRLTSPPRKASNAELIAFFDKLVAQGKA